MREGLSRRDLMAGVAATALVSACATTSASASSGAIIPVAGEWPAYGGTYFANKYSPLAQIDKSNVSKLAIAWEWNSPDAPIFAADSALGNSEFQQTPIMVGGLLYTSTALNQVVALDPATGKAVWTWDPGYWRKDGPYPFKGIPTSKGWQHRGVSYFDDGGDGRIIIATVRNHLVALNARSGAPVETFGERGWVDLASVGMQRPLDRSRTDLFATTSPPAICRNTIVVGQYIHDRLVVTDMPPGAVRGFDVMTGKLKWTFHTVPQKGEEGYETWLNGSADRNGGANIWAPMSADEELGMVYLPGSCPTDNFYGGPRPGDNLYGNSLIALDAETGKRRWHFQFVHHDIWDYDLPCAPNLADIVVDGKPIKAVAQATKQGFLFVFDRTNGKPVWPIVETKVPPSEIPGERASPTQPIPTKPKQFEPNGFTEDMLIDSTPEVRAEAKKIIDGYVIGPVYTPYGHKPTVMRPGWLGGSNWHGCAVDPETGIMYIPSQSAVGSLALDDKGERLSGANETEEIAGRSGAVRGPRGLPIIKPPYGRITAIDLNSGEHVWMKANGPGLYDDPAMKQYFSGWVGHNGRTGPLLTKTLLFVGEGPHGLPVAKRVIRAWDKATGDVLAEIALPGFTLGPPMTYMANGKQYIVCGMGIGRQPHKLVALALT